MRVSEAILTRRTARTFEPRPVPADVLDEVLRAGMWAPSPRNWQPWRFIQVHDGPDKTFLHELAIESKEISAYWVPMFRPEGLREYIQDLEHTPVTLIVTADPDARGRHVGDRWGHILGAAMAVENIKLMAHARGLGVVQYTHWVEEKVNVYFNIPRLWNLVGVLCMGYPIRLETKERRSAMKRRPLQDLASLELFGEKHTWGKPAFADTADIREAIFARRSVRRFRPDPVLDAAVAQLLTAAQWAPSAGNHQPWRFVVIRGAEAKRALRANAVEAHVLSRHWQSGNPAEGNLEAPHDYEGSPLLIAIAADPARGGPHIHGEATHIIAAGLCAQNMALMAHALGLGSVFLNHLVHEKVKALLGIPYELDLAGVMAFGAPAETPRSTRLEKDQVVYDGGFENRKGFTAVGVRHSGMRQAMAEYDVWRKRQGGKPRGTAE